MPIDRAVELAARCHKHFPSHRTRSEEIEDWRKKAGGQPAQRPNVLLVSGLARKRIGVFTKS